MKVVETVIQSNSSGFMKTIKQKMTERSPVLKPWFEASFGPKQLIVLIYPLSLSKWVTTSKGERKQLKFFEKSSFGGVKAQLICFGYFSETRIHLFLLHMVSPFVP